MQTMVKSWRRANSLHKSITIAFAIALVLFIVGGLISPGFMGWGHVSQVLVLASFLGIAAGGQTLVILTGGIDLSIPALMTAGAIIASNLVAHNAHPLWLAVIVSIGLMAIVGGINGLGVVYVGIPPMVMTLGMNTLLLGATLVYEYGQPFGTASPFVSRVVRGSWGPISYELVIWIVLGVALSVLMSRTVFGRKLYAVGTDILTTYFSGISIPSAIVGVYVGSGVLAAVSGILLSGFTGYAALNMADPYQLETIAAVVIGGASILGGRGHYLGTVAGSIIVTVLTAILLVVNIPEGVRDIFYGFIILGALFLYGRERTTRA